MKNTINLSFERAAAVSAKNKAAKAAVWDPVKVSVKEIFGTFTEPPTYLVAKVGQSGQVGKFRKPKEKAKPVKTRKTCQTESQEQCAVIAWCDSHPVAKHIFAIPNGAHKSMASAAKFKREGLRKGAPDLFLPIARNNWHGLFIEMKRTKGSVISREQKEWQAFLRNQKYAAFVCHGADEAINIIKEYLK